MEEMFAWCDDDGSVSNCIYEQYATREYYNQESSCSSSKNKAKQILCFLNMKRENHNNIWLYLCMYILLFPSRSQKKRWGKRIVDPYKRKMEIISSILLLLLPPIILLQWHKKQKYTKNRRIAYISLAFLLWFQSRCICLSFHPIWGWLTGFRAQIKMVRVYECKCEIFV